MTRISLPVLASVSLLALGLVALPASVDLQNATIGSHAAWAAKGGNGHGGGNGGGNGHGGGASGGSADTDVSSVDTPETDVAEKSLPAKAIENKTNSGAYHSANYNADPTAETTGKTPNPNSAVSYSQPPSTEEPTGEEPTAEEPTTEEPTGEAPVVDGEIPSTEDPATL